MKPILLALFISLSAFAQQPVANLAASCGPRSASFHVTQDDSRHTFEPATPGKARVYFVQDDGSWGDHQHYTLKIGLDGAWVGAYKQNSYFTLSVDPGEHHVCANVQSNSSWGNLVALAHFTARPGSVYYFRTRFLAGIPGSRPPIVDLDPIDSDEGKYLVAYYPLSVWRYAK